MAAVERLDRDHQHEAAAAGLVRPHALHARNAGRFELVPHRAAAVGAEIERVVVRRHRRDRAHQDRVVAIHQRVDPDRRLEIAAAGVVAGPFAERPFLDLVVGMDEAFEGDLRIGRHRQAGLRHVDDLDRLAEDAAGGLQLVLAVGNLDAAQHDQRRMHAGDHGDRAGLAALVVFAHDDQAVLAGRHHHRRDVRLVRLHAIGAVVDPAGIGILHHDQAGGADERPAVVLVPDRRRDLLDVDVLAFEHVVEQRPAVDGLRRLRRRVLEVVAPPLDLLHLGAFRRQAERDVDARDRGEDVGDDAVALGKAGDLVEHHRRIAHLAHIDVDDAADLFLRLGAR